MTDEGQIDDDEVLYRRIPVKMEWFDPVRNEVKPDAFRPTKSDTAGISVDRGRSDTYPEFRSIEQAAQGRQDEYFVAVLTAGKVAAAGFRLIPEPEEGNPGHALIADLTYNTRRSTDSENKRVLLAHQLVDRVEGPFPRYRLE